MAAGAWELLLRRGRLQLPTRVRAERELPSGLTPSGYGV